MTTIGGRERPGLLAYWRLPAADRQAVRRIARTGRAAGDRRLDALALDRLRRGARWTRLLSRFATGRDREPNRIGPDSQLRLERLCSTMRHPSRTGVCAGTAPPRTGAATSQITHPRRGAAIPRTDS